VSNANIVRGRSKAENRGMGGGGKKFRFKRPVLGRKKMGWVGLRFGFVLRGEKKGRSRPMFYGKTGQFSGAVVIRGRGTREEPVKKLGEKSKKMKQ